LFRGSAGLYSNEAGGASGAASSMPAWAKSDRRSNNVRNAEGDLRKKSKNKDRRGSKSKPSDVDNLNGSTLERDIDQEDIFEREETL